MGYTAWLFCANGVMMPLGLLAVRKRSAQRLRIPPAILKRGMVAGAISVLAYGLVLWAQTKSALAVVAALRETGVVFAALIGAVVFREHLPVRRLLASAAIGAGAALLALG